MTKLLCPLCRLSTFGVPTTHQLHINAHLLSTHNIRVTPATQPLWRERQDLAWETKFDAVEQELEEACARHRRRVRDAQDEGRLPLDHDGEGGGGTLEALQEVYAELEDMDSDGEESMGEFEEGEEGYGWVLGSVALVEGEVDGGKYSKSLRHYQMAEGRARAWEHRTSKKPADVGSEAVEVDRPDALEEDRDVEDFANGFELVDDDDGAGDGDETEDEKMPAKKVFQYLAAARRREKQQAAGLMVRDSAARIAESERDLELEREVQ